MPGEIEALLHDGQAQVDDGGMQWAEEIREAVEARQQAQEMLKQRPQPARPVSLMRRPAR